MTSDEAVDFLMEHQPMPPDEALSEELITQFDEARRALERHPDPRGLPLLLHSFGEGTGFGVYQLVGDTIRAYGRADVIAALSNALESSFLSVRSWAMEIALEYPDERLVPHAVGLLRSRDRDSRYFAASYLVDLGSNDAAVAEALRDAAQFEDDDEIRDVLTEAQTG